MIVARINQLDGIPFPGGISFRPVIRKHGLGFSVHKTVIPKGPPNRWQYKNHLEACYCIKGKGILTEIDTGITHYITPDTVYMLNNHDNHTFEALEDVVLISIFNPPVIGHETHDANGNYSL